MTASEPGLTSSNQRHHNKRGKDVQVRTGWSGEVEPNVWRKVDVELEEEDLHRLMLEHSLPEYFHERLPVVVAFELLQAHSEILLLRKLTTLGYPADKATARIRELAEAMATVIAQAQQKLADAQTAANGAHPSEQEDLVTRW